MTGRVAEAFAAFFGDRAGELPQQSASEDFSDLPTAFGAPYSYWGIGALDTGTEAIVLAALGWLGKA